MSDPALSTTSKISISFNQDYSCCVVSVDRGFVVYSCDPLKERFRRDIGGSPLIVEPLFRSNLLAFVGGRYPPNKVQIWDDLKPGIIADLEFRTPVRNVKIRRDRICVALEDKIVIYNFSDLRHLAEIPTTANPHGLLAISPDSNLIVICPGSDVGLLHIESFDTPTHQTHMLRAHNGPLSNIVISCDGTKVATASDKGTLIRVFDTTSGALLNELRRGIDQADITSIAFNSINTYLALISDKGTVHIYNLIKPGLSGVSLERRTECSQVLHATTRALCVYIWVLSTGSRRKRDWSRAGERYSASFREGSIVYQIGDRS